MPYLLALFYTCSTSSTHSTRPSTIGNLSSEVVYVDLERGNVAVGGFDRCVVQGEELQWTPDSSAFLGMTDVNSDELLRD